MVVPMPTANPSTAATMGFSLKRTALMNRKTGLFISRGGFSKKSCRSFPEEKSGPSPVRTITRMSSLALASSMCWVSASYISTVSAFLRFWRSMASVMIGPSRVRRMDCVMASFLGQKEAWASGELLTDQRFVIFHGGMDDFERVLSSVDFIEDRKSTRLNSSHVAISYAVFCLKKKKVFVLD